MKVSDPLGRAERQRVDARAGAVEQPEAVLALLDVQEGPDLAVDQHLVAEEDVLHVRRVEQRAVRS